MRVCVRVINQYARLGEQTEAKNRVGGNKLSLLAHVGLISRNKVSESGDTMLSRVCTLSPEKLITRHHYVSHKTAAMGPR